VVGHGREVLALVELGPVTLEALPDGVFDVAGKVAVGWPRPCRNSTAAWAWRVTQPPAGCCHWPRAECTPPGPDT
jgi:hypothetical protein